MKTFFKSLCLGLLPLSALAGMPQPRIVEVSWSRYWIPTGGSNAVITVWKSTSLGTVWSPWKPTAVTPASRTNVFVSLTSGSTYRFYCTATVQPFGDSDPSNVVTNRIE